MLDDRPLAPLPPQPAGTPWPTTDWPTGGALPPEAADAIDEMITQGERYGQTYAVLVVQGGRLLLERYTGVLEHWDRPAEPVDASTRLLSWSMAKSILHAAIGIAVGDGLLDPAAPAPVPEWQGTEDPRHAITLEHLLSMRDGLDFTEEYVIGTGSDVVEMLFGEGKDDVAAYAAARPPRAEPGSTFAYSSGTSNIVARILGDVLGGEAATRAFLTHRLFEPLGMTGAEPRFDPAGTFIGSSYVYAPARDYARFGLLYLRGGCWDGDRLLPDGWVDHGRRARSVDPTDGRIHGAHWWSDDDGLGTFRASGYEGQSILLCPALDLIVVRLGKTDEALNENLVAWRARMVQAFAAL